MLRGFTNEILYACVVFSILTYRNKSSPDEGLESLQSQLDKFYRSTSGLQGLLRLRPEATPSEGFLRAILKEAYFKATSLSGPLFQLVELLEATRLTYLSKKRMMQLMRGRISLFICLAFLGRVGIRALFLTKPGNFSWYYLDCGLLGISLALLAGGLILIYRLLPNDWLWLAGFTPAAQNWLRYRLIEESSGTDALGLRLLELRRSGLLSGSHFGRERRQVLRFYAREQHQSIAAQTAKFAEVLPLVDFMVVGLPALLILIVPGMEFFGTIYSTPT